MKSNSHGTEEKHVQLNEQESAIIARLQKGDDSARNDLVESNLWIAGYMAGKFAGPGNCREDLTSIAYVGLVKAMNSFDPARNVKPASYAARCIKNELLMYLRRDNRAIRTLSLEQPLGHAGEGGDMRIGDVVSTDDESVMRQVLAKEDKAEVQEAVKNLDDRERKMLEMRFGIRDGCTHTQAEVAAFFDITQSYVSKIEKKILKKMKNHLKE